MKKGYLLPGVKRKVFDNGLVLLTEKIPRAQKVVLLVGVKVGSINESDQLNGGSHFNEHMLFKSNQYRTAKQITEDLEFDGTSINASTSHTSTVFYTKALPDKLFKAIEVIYQAATNFEYDQEEFSRERKVILTEIQLFIEQPVIYCLEKLFIPALFKGTPLEKTIGGTEKSMGTVSKQDLEQFKKDFYLPNNMAIVAVGKFDQKKLERKIEATFGKLEPRSLPTQDLTVNLLNRKTEKFESHSAIKQTYLNIGFKVPGFIHPDTHRLRLLDGILSVGMSSRMFQKLREERGIGYAVGSFFESFGKAGIFDTYVSGFDPSRFNETKEIILREMNDLKTNLVTDKEYEGTKNLLISRHFDVLEFLSPRARKILATEFDELPYDFREIPSYLNEVTKKDLIETAQRYLTDQYTLTALVPEGFNPF